MEPSEEANIADVEIVGEIRDKQSILKGKCIAFHQQAMSVMREEISQTEKSTKDIRIHTFSLDEERRRLLQSTMEVMDEEMSSKVRAIQPDQKICKVKVH
jgi:hypothetical protein